MPPHSFDFLEQLNPALMALLWGLIGIAIAWNIVPPLGHVLGQTRFSCHSTADADAARAGAEDFHEALAQLGFQPLGIVQEDFWLYFFHWHKQFRTAVWHSRERKCFACLYRLTEQSPLRLAFASVLTDGTLIWTANGQPEFVVRKPDHVRTGHEVREPAELLRQHEAELGLFKAPQPSDQFTELMSALARVERRSVIETQGSALNYVLLPLFFLGIFPLITSAGPRKGPLFVFSYSSILAGLLLGSFFLLVFRLMLLPQALRMSSRLASEQPQQE